MGCCCGKNRRKRGPRSVYTPNKQNEVQKALRELVDTERAFGEDLQYLVENYLDPLRTEVIFFDNTDLILFNNVTLDLTQVQRKFQDKLVAHTEKIGDTGSNLAEIVYDVANDFVSSEKDFDVFAKYVVAMTKLQTLLSDVSSNQDIIQFLEKRAHSTPAQSDNTKTGRKHMTISSIILTPFQRPLKYPLILERLEKQADEGTVDKMQLRDAIESVQRVATKMNETLKRDEKTGEEYKQLLKLYGISEYRHKK